MTTATYAPTTPINTVAPQPQQPYGIFSDLLRTVVPNAGHEIGGLAGNPQLGNLLGGLTGLSQFNPGSAIPPAYLPPTAQAIPPQLLQALSPQVLQSLPPQVLQSLPPQVLQSLSPQVLQAIAQHQYQQHVQQQQLPFQQQQSQQQPYGILGDLLRSVTPFVGQGPNNPSGNPQLAGQLGNILNSLAGQSPFTTGQPVQQQAVPPHLAQAIVQAQILQALAQQQQLQQLHQQHQLHQQQTQQQPYGIIGDLLRGMTPNASQGPGTIPGNQQFGGQGPGIPGNQQFGGQGPGTLGGNPQMAAQLGNILSTLAGLSQFTATPQWAGQTGINPLSQYGVN